MIGPEGYEAILASDVSERDGLGFELYDPEGRQVLEIFRNDDDFGRLTVNLAGEVSLPFIVLDWAMRTAELRLHAEGSIGQ